MVFSSLREGNAPHNELVPGSTVGSEVAQHHRDGRIQDLADYCESDVVNTYRVWLRYGLSRRVIGGRISSKRGQLERLRSDAQRYEAAPG